MYRGLTLFIVHTIKPSYFASLTNWDYVQVGLFSYLNESHFELNSFSSTSIQQFKTSLTFKCLIEHLLADFSYSRPLDTYL